MALASKRWLHKIEPGELQIPKGAWVHNNSNKFYSVFEILLRHNRRVQQTVLALVQNTDLHISIHIVVLDVITV